MLCVMCWIQDEFECIYKKYKDQYSIRTSVFLATFVRSQQRELIDERAFGYVFCSSFIPFEPKDNLKADETQ